MVRINPQSVNYFAKNLKFLIKRYATNQDQLASYIGKNQTSISNWINEVSEPDISVLVKIHEFFGISTDAILFLDLEKGKVVTDTHVEHFKRIGKVNREVLGKVEATDKRYFVGDTGLESVVNEPDSILLYNITGQFKNMSEKLEQLRVLGDSILKKVDK